MSVSISQINQTNVWFGIRHQAEKCLCRTKPFFFIIQMSVYFHTSVKQIPESVSDTRQINVCVGQMPVSAKTFFWIRQMSVSVSHINQINLWVDITHQRDKCLFNRKIFFCIRQIYIQQTLIRTYVVVVSASHIHFTRRHSMLT